SKKKKKSYKTINRPPGTIYYRGKKQFDSTKLDIISYNKETAQNFKSEDPEDTLHYRENVKVNWININGLNNASHLERLGKIFDLHSLTLEDVSNTAHRPKVDEFDDYLFIIIKMLHFNKNEELVFEQLSMVVGKDYVLTFQEADGDVFDELRERIYSDKGR